MAKLTANQQAYALITLFEKHYIKKYGRKPDINRHRDKWGFQDMVEDLGYPLAQEIVEYYFDLNYINHPVQTLLRNYDKFNRVRDERREDEANRLRLRAETKKRVEEWEKTHGNDRI